MRSYAGDVSRLVDVSRQAVVFENLQDLTSCFLAICRDPEIVIERVKNRLDNKYRSSTSAGYRDLNINLRLVSHDAIQNGVTSEFSCPPFRLPTPHCCLHVTHAHSKPEI